MNEKTTAARDLHLRRNRRAHQPGNRAGPAAASKRRGHTLFIRRRRTGTGKGFGAQGRLCFPNSAYFQFSPLVPAARAETQFDIRWKSDACAPRGPAAFAGVSAGCGGRHRRLCQLSHGTGRLQGKDPNGDSRVKHGARPHYADAGAVCGPGDGGRDGDLPWLPHR